MFTQLVGVMPFVVEGLTSGYKHKGYYPEVEKEYVEILDISELENYQIDMFDLIVVANCNDKLKIEVQYVYDRNYNKYCFDPHEDSE